MGFILFAELASRFNCIHSEGLDEKFSKGFLLYLYIKKNYKNPFI